MSTVKRLPIEIEFEGKKFDFYTDNDGHPHFDNYLLKSEPNVIDFQYDHAYVKILSSKFPHGKYGAGYYIHPTIIRGIDESNGKCMASGIGGSSCFDTEFEAQLYAIKRVLQYGLVYGYHTDKIKKQLNDFINPKSLF